MPGKRHRARIAALKTLFEVDSVGHPPEEILDRQLQDPPLPELTELTEHIPQQVIDMAMDRIFVGRVGTPEDIAACVAFLASEEASYISGQVIPVDGGLGN